MKDAIKLGHQLEEEDEEEEEKAAHEDETEEQNEYEEGEEDYTESPSANPDLVNGHR